jgi:hypothetical protein
MVVVAGIVPVIATRMDFPAYVLRRRRDPGRVMPPGGIIGQR